MSVDLIDALDVIGISAFALSGGIVAIRRGMDVVGVVALAIVTGFGGGVARDVLIADLPPQVVRDDGLLLVAVAAGLAALATPRLVGRRRQTVLVLDAVGLGLFATVGAAKASEAGLGVVSTVLVGTVAAVGGGLVRDLLADEVPQIFVSGSRLYAVPAALGALLVAVGFRQSWNADVVQLVAAGVTVALRLSALRLGWHAPVPGWSSKRVAPDGLEGEAGSHGYRARS